MAATAENLKQTIAEAFADVPAPADDRIAKCSRPECDECAGIRWGFKQLTHDLVRPYELEYHHGALPLLFPEAFHYFISDYMCYSVEHPISQVAEFTRYSLAPTDYDDFWRERFLAFSAPHKQAVIAFLEFLRAQEIEGDDEDHWKYKDSIDDGIKIWKSIA
jgi:hypothetical protein